MMSPDNPFSEPAEEELLFSKDLGTLVSSQRNTPRNAHTFVRRTNRTQQSNDKESNIEFERANQEAFEVATTVDPSLILSIPNSKTSLSTYISSNIDIAKEAFDFTEEERAIIEEASTILKVGRPMVRRRSNITPDIED